MKSKNILWLMGNIISLGTGIAIGTKYGFWIGTAVGYSLLLLVDIREQTTPNVKLRGSEAVPLE